MKPNKNISMKIIWLSDARKGLLSIGKYIQKEFGVQRRLKFTEQVRKTESLLLDNPHSGKTDPLFTERTYLYRSVVINGLSKLVYRVDGESIYVVAFWDTRQEPEAQAAQIER